MLLRFFINLYNMEVIEEETYMSWKEDITDEFPGKGKALFQVCNICTDVFKNNFKFSLYTFLNLRRMRQKSGDRDCNLRFLKGKWFNNSSWDLVDFNVEKDASIISLGFTTYKLSAFVIVSTFCTTFFDCNSKMPYYWCYVCDNITGTFSKPHTARKRLK